MRETHELLDTGRVEFDVVSVADVLVGALRGYDVRRNRSIRGSARVKRLPFPSRVRTQVVGPLTPVVFCNALSRSARHCCRRFSLQERTLNRVQTPHAPTLTDVLSAVPRMT